jgi:hypothetical protein
VVLVQEEQDQQHRDPGDDQAARADPGAVAVAREQPRDDEDRRAHAHRGMEDSEMRGEQQIRVPDLGVVADAGVVRVFGVEPEPVDQRLLVDTVRRTEQREPGQAEPPPVSHLAAQQRAAAVERDEQGEVPRQQQLERGCRGRQHLPQVRCDQQQREDGTPSHAPILILILRRPQST